MRHRERHRSGRSGWLRASLLGANDGLLSTASLILGVAAAGATRGDVLVAGTAGLVAGAMSMAAGEYVSVSSQADAARADLQKERRELAEDPDSERRELARIYVARGLDPALAERVSEALMAHDALEAHARDELGLTPAATARPLQAAFASGAAFSAGAALPLLVAGSAAPVILAAVAGSSVLFLALLGATAARLGGANMLIGAARVTFWGVAAMALTAAVGMAFGTAA